MVVVRVWRRVQTTCLILGQRRSFGHSSTVSQNGTLDHLTHLSDQLFAENPSRYDLLRPPPSSFRDLDAEQPDQTDLVNDWNEVLGTMDGMKVTPEVADQLSGAIYMHALMQEDVTSKCIRVSDYVADLSRTQLTTIVENISRWSALSLADVHNSDMLQLIITRLDKQCCALQDPDQKLAHSFCRLIRYFKATECNFVGQFFERISADSREKIVCKLLLAAFCHNSHKAPITVDQDLMRLLAVQIHIMFDNMTPTELAVCFAGLQVISPSKEVSQLGDKIASRYGFRLLP